MQTDSEVLRDHKAFFLDMDKDLLSIPISSYDGYYRAVESRDPLYRESGLWNGFYVFGLNGGEEITLKGTIQHDNNNDYVGTAAGSRSFFIEDTLYTVTPGLMKMNDLNDVQVEKNVIELGGS